MLTKLLKPLFFIALVLSLVLIMRHFTNNAPINTIDSTSLYAANLPDASGKMQNLAQYHNKIIIVNFWATWCPPCREEMPELVALQQAYQDKNVVVLGIALNEPSQVAEYLKTTPINYPTVADESAGSLLSEQLGNDKGVLPYTVIINTDGQVVRAYFGRITKSLIEETIKPLISH